MSGFKTIYCYLSGVCGLIWLSWAFHTGLSPAIEVRRWLEPQSSEVLTEQDTQDGTLGWLAVEAGCWLGVQLECDRSNYTWPLHVVWLLTAQRWVPRACQEQIFQMAVVEATQVA